MPRAHMVSVGATELSLVLFVVVSTALWLASLVWVYRDAEQRGRTAWLVTLLAAVVAWPVGLIIWLVARPERDAR